jgi:HlyD family secretion protein
MGFLVFIIYKATENQHVDISTINAEYRDIEEKLIVSGTVEPLKEIEVKSTISGVLDTLFVQIGDEVAIGQAIAKVQFVLDPMEYEQLKKEFDVAKAQFENAKNEFIRTEILFNKGVISREEFEKEQTNFTMVESEYKSVNTKLDMVKGNYQKEEVSNIITATGNGVVLELPIKEGGSVMARGTWNEGSAIARIADLKSLIFKGNILESDILKLRTGMKISFSVATKRDITFDGVLYLINPKALAVAKDGMPRFEIAASIYVPEEYNSYVRAGGSANGEIVLEHKEHVLALNEKYFQFNYDSVFVEVENNKGVFEKRFIETGISDGIYTEIISGIDSLSKIKNNT